MSHLYILLGIWVALNSAFPIVMLNKRHQAELRHRLYRWLSLRFDDGSLKSGEMP
jgi:hypothetical protein